MAKVRYYEVEFGILADGAQTDDYEAVHRMCIKATHWPSIKDAERFLHNDMVASGCDCVNSVKWISEEDAQTFYGVNDFGDMPVYGYEPTTFELNLYDKHGNTKTIVFDVKTNWLVNTYGIDFDYIAEFLDKYDCEDAMDIYLSAIIDCALV